MCPAVPPTAPEATKTRNSRQRVLLVLQAELQGRMVGWLAQAKNCNSLQTFLQHQPLLPTPHWHCRAAKRFCLGG
eukprot:1136419-Pelagomonas_calceolata.AAC.3